MNEERETQGYGAETPPVRTSGLAIASLVLAILCATAPIALILGIIALIQTIRNPQLRGQGLAIAGIVISVLAMFVWLIVAVSIPALVRARERAQASVCITNLKQLNMALNMYSADYDQRFPLKDNWNESLQPYYKKRSVLICPSVGDGTPSYGANDLIAGIQQSDVKSPFALVSFFDSIPGLNESGGEELLPSPPRHLGRNNVGFVDGHVESVEQLNPFNWDPAAPPGQSPPARQPAPSSG